MDFLNKLFGKKQSEPSSSNATHKKQPEKETAQVPKAITPTNIHMSLGVEKGGEAVATLSIPRESVEHPSETTRDELNRLVDGIAARSVREGTLIRIAPTIDGYNNDPRELLEVPEVCAWARDTLSLLPGLWCFLDKGSQAFFVVWSCGPLSRNEMGLPKFQALFMEKNFKYVNAATVAFSKLLEKAGANEAQISHLTIQSMMTRK
jgi:hypothetical protein